MVCKSLRPWLPVMALAVAFAGSSALGQEKQAPAAAPRATGQETNSSRSFDSHGLKDFEQSIFKPFRSMEPEGSLNAVMERPQRPPAVPNKRAKEMMERRRDWAFMTPEEIINGKDSDPLNSGKEDDSKMLSPMDRYFQRLYGEDKRKGNKSKEAGKKNSMVGRDKSDSYFGDPEDQDDNGGLPETVRETRRNLKKKGDDKKGPEEEKVSSVFSSDVFALERKKPSVEEERVERARMDAYRKSLGLDPAPTFGASFSPVFVDPKDPYRITLPPALMSSSVVPTAAPAPVAHVVPTANPFMDTASKAGVAPSSLTPTLPKVEPPKSYVPPQPTFTAPRRSF